MKRCLTVVMAASMLVAFVGVAQAKNGMPSQATLQAMGLSGLQVMSDSEAMNVRGLGYQSYGGKSKAIAFGVSYAHVGGHGGSAGSLDGFYAEGKHYAGGAHGSIAGKIVITKGGKKRRRGGDNGGNWRNDSPMPYGGGGHGGGGHGGGGVQVKATIVFAGGFAHSSAH